MGGAGAVYALLLVPVRSRPTPVTPATRPSAPAYDVDAAFMHMERHERGIHALQPDTDGVSVTEVGFRRLPLLARGGVGGGEPPGERVV